MASREEIARKYAERIINSRDKMEEASSVKRDIDKLTYENSGNYISEEDKDFIWDEIEKIVRQVEYKKIKELNEQTNVSTLDIISLVRGKKKKRK